jgi:hypothetical protein
MGIVVTVFMLLGLLAVSPFSWLNVGTSRRCVQVIGLGLLLAGMWNTFWHGLRFWGDFWGIAAVVSGSFMVLVAIIILHKFSYENRSIQSLVTFGYKIVSPLSIVWIVGLFLSFLLYAITLIRLNIGLSVIS